MNQSRLGSLIEATFNVLIGYGVAVGSQIVIFPWFGISIPIRDNFIIGLWFTLVSIVRSYAIRRWFNARLQSAAATIARKVS